MNFSQFGSYATVPNVNITLCNFTIAFWIRLFQPVSGSSHSHTIMMGKTISGNLFSLFVQVLPADTNFEVFFNREVSVNTTSQTLVTFTADINSWIHVAVTCEQDNKVRMYVNGELFQTADSLFDIPVQNTFSLPKETYRIGNHPGPFIQMYGSIMNLHIIRFGLPPDDISDLFTGQQIVISCS